MLLILSYNIVEQQLLIIEINSLQLSDSNENFKFSVIRFNFVEVL